MVTYVSSIVIRDEQILLSKIGGHQWTLPRIRPRKKEDDLEAVARLFGQMSLSVTGTRHYKDIAVIRKQNKFMGGERILFSAISRSYFVSVDGTPDAKSRAYYFANVGGMLLNPITEDVLCSLRKDGLYVPAGFENYRCR